jgi:chemotaxis protein CheZ
MQPRKLFRIEQVGPLEDTSAGLTGCATEAIPPASANDADAALRHLEVITEIREVRALIEGRATEAQQTLERFQAQFNEFHKLKAELDVISNAIVETKRELATIHVSGFNGQEMSRVANELDAVVDDTEHATQAILGAVEDIDSRADKLAGAAADETHQATAREIQDCVIRIFEACNFQDLTGQRISKVVAALKFIEDHIRRMEEIWGGIESFGDFSPRAAEPPVADEEDGLLNGPKLEGDIGHVSQNDIDALFE